MSDDTGSKGAKPPARRRWLWPVLVISLALNLLFVGLMAGSWWRHGKHGGRDKVFAGAIERLMKELPEAKRQHAAELLERRREAVKPVRGQIRQARDAAKKAVLTEPYDEEKVAAALAQFRDISTGQHEATHEMLMELMKGLNLQERQKLLDYIQEGFRKRWRRKRDKERKSDNAGR